MLERPIAHVCETGGMRRVHLRGHPNIRKRLLVHVAGCNLGLLMRRLQGRAAALFRALISRLHDLWVTVRRFSTLFLSTSSQPASSRRGHTD